MQMTFSHPPKTAARVGCILISLLVTALLLGCAKKVPPPKPPVFGELIELDLGEVPLAETALASHAIAEVIQLPRKATLRIKGAYRSSEPDHYLPISAGIMGKSSKGTPVTFASGATSVAEQGNSSYGFTVDVRSDLSAASEYELVLSAGKQFIAHGKVIVKD
jgi:hypothetical protein